MFDRQWHAQAEVEANALRCSQEGLLHAGRIKGDSQIELVQALITVEAV